MPVAVSSEGSRTSIRIGLWVGDGDDEEVSVGREDVIYILY